MEVVDITLHLPTGRSEKPSLHSTIGVLVLVRRHIKAVLLISRTDIIVIVTLNPLPDIPI